MLYQTIRRRVLLTGGSGVDSTVTAGLAAAFETGVAAPRAGGGIGGPAGFSGAAIDSVFGLVSTPTTSRKSHGSRKLKVNYQLPVTLRALWIATTYTITRDTGTRNLCETIAVCSL